MNKVNLIRLYIGTDGQNYTSGYKSAFKNLIETKIKYNNFIDKKIISLIDNFDLNFKIIDEKIYIDDEFIKTYSDSITVSTELLKLLTPN